MFLTNIYISFCIKDFDKPKLISKLKEINFCTGFLLKNIFFHKISTSMDSAIGLLLKVDTIAYVSGNFGLSVRIVVTFSKSQMAEQGKNNKIQYKTMILHLNIISKRTDLIFIKNNSKWFTNL